MKKKQLTALGAISAIIVLILIACENPFFPAADAEIPLISAHPQNAVYTVGKPAVALAVGATVNDGGTLSYQWYSSASGGTAIIGANADSYIPSTDANGTSYYYVVVTNTLKASKAWATSDTARVEVNAKVNAAYPQITSQPASYAEYTFLDASAPLTVFASVNDGGTLSYKWYSNTTNSTIGRTEVGTNSDSFIPPTDIGTGTMYYYVEVINTIADNDDGGNKSASIDSIFVSIKINPKPIETAAVNVTGPEMLETPDTTASTQEQSYDCGLVLWSPAASTFLGGTVYTATVTLTAKANYIFDTTNFTATINGGNTTVTNLTAASVTISHTFGATLASQVKSIAVQQQPSKLTYTHGEELDLSGLLVRLTYEDNTYDDVAPVDFGSKNISAVPTDGTELKYSTHDYTRVAVYYGARSDETQRLSVNRKTLTVSGAVHTRPYNGTTDTDGIIVTLAGIIPSETDTVGIASVSAGYPSPNAGTNTVNVYNVTLTGSDSGNYTVTLPANNIVVGGITKVTPTVTTWPTAGNIDVGNVLSASVLNGGSASVQGSFMWTDGNATPTVGTHTNYTVTFTPQDQTNYSSVESDHGITVTVEGVAPVVTWPTAASRTYSPTGTLSQSALTGGVAKNPTTNETVPGSFAWTNPSTVPIVPNNGYSVTFTPTDTASYRTVINPSVPIVVSKATPTVNWSGAMVVGPWTGEGGINFDHEMYSPHSWVVGTSANIPGSFTLSDISTNYKHNTSVTVIFTPTDTVNYNTVNSGGNIVKANILYRYVFTSLGVGTGYPANIPQGYNHPNPTGEREYLVSDNSATGGYTYQSGVAGLQNSRWYKKGDSFSLPTVGTLSRSGYTFGGWATSYGSTQANLSSFVPGTSGVIYSSSSGTPKDQIRTAGYTFIYVCWK